MQSANLQRAIFDKLNNDVALGALVVGVYAEHPQPDDAGSDADFPYVTIGTDIGTSWDTKTFNGGSHLIQIDAWSRANNFLEVKDIADAIRSALHYASLTIIGAEFVVSINESNTFTRDPDGHTKRALCMYRMMTKG